MREISLEGRGDFAEWRLAARDLLHQNVAPPDVRWRIETDGDDLFAVSRPSSKPAEGDVRPLSVPRSFMEAAEAAICHSDPDRFSLLYRLLWRLQSESRLWGDRADPDIVRLAALVKNVRRDCHKMKAFVRFREVEPDRARAGRRRFIVWFEPDHFIVTRTAPFFQRRFTDMDWVIGTPKGSAAWDGQALKTSCLAAEKSVVEDETDELWRTYFANIFNPARVKIKAMQAEMPKKYWKNMPEADLIPSLIAGAEKRVAEMAARAASQPPVFHERLQAAWQSLETDGDLAALEPLEALRREAAACQRCPLHCDATQTVFGEGEVGASILFVGEQPGDREDLAGRPFVGPAGDVFNQAMALAGIRRDSVYVTNAVKHFKYEMRGKRRIHRRPERPEIEQCRHWLQRELEIVGSRIVVALGATAYLALTGETAPVDDVRGYPIPMTDGRILVVTTHPAHLLRLPEGEQRQKALARFQSDMQAVAALYGSLQSERSDTVQKGF